MSSKLSASPITAQTAITDKVTTYDTAATAPEAAIAALHSFSAPIVLIAGGADKNLPFAGFAAAIAGFGQLLTGGKYLGPWGWQEAIALATAAKGEDPYGYRSEAIQLMRLAESLEKAP